MYYYFFFVLDLHIIVLHKMTLLRLQREGKKDKIQFLPSLQKER